MVVQLGPQEVVYSDEQPELSLQVAEPGFIPVSQVTLEDPAQLAVQLAASADAAITNATATHTLNKMHSFKRLLLDLD